MLPKPTAEPAAAITKPNLDPHVSRGCALVLVATVTPLKNFISCVCYVRRRKVECIKKFTLIRILGDPNNVASKPV